MGDENEAQGLFGTKMRRATKAANQIMEMGQGRGL